jgi:biopolymer transport protein ExbD
MQSSTAAKGAATAAQPMQRGVSVQMASANSAQAMPEADNTDAWIVTVSDAGRLYFGTNPVTSESLKQWMIRHPRQRGQRLYIKADARAPFADVEKALDAASAADFESPVLLVAGQLPSTPGTMVSPKGLEVLVDGAPNSSAKNATVEVATSPQGSSTLRINNTDVAWADLQNRIGELVQNDKEKIILLTADARSPFAQVARVIDACRLAGAKVVLGSQEL